MSFFLSLQSKIQTITTKLSKLNRILVAKKDQTISKPRPQSRQAQSIQLANKAQGRRMCDEFHGWWTVCSCPRIRLVNCRYQDLTHIPVKSCPNYQIFSGVAVPGSCGAADCLLYPRRR